ncbi:ankyrin repeat-containing domain protein [Nemania abortiva]|nr:ankyrin repeat-containing domain protein [Nemania abortiva]
MSEAESESGDTLPVSVPNDDASRDDVVEGTSHEGVIFKSLVGPDEGFIPGKQPDIDVIHVVGIGTEDEPLCLSSFISSDVESRKRTFTFRIDIAGLMTGDLSMASIELQAQQLLDGICYFRRFEGDKNPSGRAIAFVAYDLGALVLKKAISLAGIYRDRWPDVFSHAAQILFYGCFQRTQDAYSLRSKVSEFLYTNAKEPWKKYLSPTSVASVARASTETTEVFLGSRVTLCSRVTSLYAKEGIEAKIHPVFDYFTGTLGVPVELPIEEQDGEIQFPNLASKVCFQVNKWVPHQSWIPFEQTLVSLALPHSQSTLVSPIPSHPILDTQAHHEWLKSRGIRILSIEGGDSKTRRDAAEQVFLAWQTKQIEREEYATKNFSFKFSARDPLRDTIDDMIVSLLLQAAPRYDSSGSETDEYRLLKDQFNIQRAWTEKDLLLMFEQQSYRFLGTGTLILLQDIECCKKDGLAAFWDILKGEGSPSESPFKIVVTQPNSVTLLRQLGPGIPVERYIIPDATRSTDEADVAEYVNALAQDLCPNGHGEAQLRKSLLAVCNYGINIADKIIPLARSRSGWPEEPTADNLSTICSILEATSRSSTLTTVMDNALRADPDQDGLRWVLGWLLCAFRPLTRHELAWIYCNRTGSGLREPSSMRIQAAKLAIDNHLRGIADFSHDQVTIKDDVVALFKPGPDFLWTDVMASAPQMIMDFLLKHFSIWEADGCLEKAFCRYQLLCEDSHEKLIPPLIPDGKDPLFYAVQFFPNHLSAEKSYLSGMVQALAVPTGQFASWAKVFWAMSNPFSRSRECPSSAHEILLDISDLGPDVRRVLENLRQTDESSVCAELEKAFHKAVERGEEETAITLLKQLSALADSKQQIAASPNIQACHEPPKVSEGAGAITKSLGVAFAGPVLQRALWRAVRLNMGRLVTFLIEDGTSPDAPDLDSWSFPLHTAAQLGHTDIVRDLLKYGASVRRNSEINILRAAAVNGQLGTVKFLATNYPSLLEDSTPPFYMACYCGRQGVVEALVAIGADTHVTYEPEPGSPWKPLSIAIVQGHLGIMETLLKIIPDPNEYETSATLNPLYLATAVAGNSDAVRLLLKYGLNPNDELIKPPLVLEISRSNTPSEDKLDILDLLVTNNARVDLVESSTGITPLMCAAANGELSLAEWLLDHNSNVHVVDTEGWTALFHAANSNHIELVRVLLSHKPRLDIKVSSGQTLNQIVVGKEEILQLLLDANLALDLELTNDEGKTALGCAVEQKLPHAVRVLLSRKVDIHHRDNSGRTAILDSVVNAPDPEILRMLAESGADLQDAISEEGRSVLQMATIRGAELLKIVLEFRKRIDLEQLNSWGRTALHDGLLYDASEESIQLLIRAGVNVNVRDEDGLTPVMCAIYRESLTNLKLLLAEPEIDINSHSQAYPPPLILTCSRLLPDFVQSLLDRGADVNARWLMDMTWSPLIATLMGSANPGENRDELVDKIVRMLVNHGAPVRVHYETTPTHHRAITDPLQAACVVANVAMIQYLVGVGAPIDGAGPLKNLPIHFATINGVRNFEAVSQIYQGDLLVTDVAGKTVLHWAAQFSHVETLKFILDKVSSSIKSQRRKYANLPDIDGWTPLAWATRPAIGGLGYEDQSEPREITETIQYLLNEGADPWVQFTIGRGDDAEIFTPLQMAQLCDLPENAINAIKDAQACGGEAQCAVEMVTKKYTRWRGYCDVCLATVYGHAYKCDICADFDACKKCYGRIDTYHEHLKTEDGKAHTFKLRPACEKEFEDPVDSEKTDKDPSSAAGADEPDSKAGLEAPEAKADDGGLDLGDLDDLDGFDEDSGGAS